jgi:hypothetical protein
MYFFFPAVRMSGDPRKYFPPRCDKKNPSVAINVGRTLLVNMSHESKGRVNPEGKTEIVLDPLPTTSWETRGGNVAEMGIVVSRLLTCGDVAAPETVERGVRGDVVPVTECVVSSADNRLIGEKTKPEDQDAMRSELAQMVYVRLDLARFVTPDIRRLSMNARAQLIQDIRRIAIENGFGTIVLELSRLLARKLFDADELALARKTILAARFRAIDLEHETRYRTNLFYLDLDYRNRISDCIDTHSFSGYIDLKPHVKSIVAWFPPACGVLEVAAGNGYTSLFLRHALKHRETPGALLSGYVATDLFEPLQRYFSPYERGISSDAAVRKYYGQFNILIMVAPPCNVWVDYYAIKTLEIMHDTALRTCLHKPSERLCGAQSPATDSSTPFSSPTSSFSSSSSSSSTPSFSSSMPSHLSHVDTPVPLSTPPDYGCTTKYCLFVGELGASDGGPGMYHYLHGGSRWKIRHTLRINTKTDMYGGVSSRDAYFFEYTDAQ